MKILFVDHPEGDMLAGTLFLGLCRLYGAENVVDWPWKASYHGETARYPSVYGPEHGEGVTGPFAWFPAQGGRPWSEEEVRDQIGSFDLIAVSVRDHGILRLRDLIRQVGRRAFRRLVLFDGQDSHVIQRDFTQEFRPDVYAKRELLASAEDVAQGKSDAERVRIIPCPFASPLAKLPAVVKDVDFTNLGAGNFFSGVASRNGGFAGAQNKVQVDEVLRREFAGRIVFTDHVGYEAFLQITAHTRVAVCFGGFGWDTFRHWEIPSFAGTLLLRNRSPQVIPHDFVDGESCAEFSSVDELVSVARAYLDDDARRERVAVAGNALLREHHTAEVRARQLVKEAMR